MNRLIFLYCCMHICCVVPNMYARTLLVGPSRSLQTLNNASSVVASGDTVLIDSGVYTNQACTWSADNTVIKGVTKYAHLKPPAVIDNKKAILVISGNNTIVENIEFSDATVPDKNGAGIRMEGTNIIIKNCYFHNCEDGVLGGNGTVIIKNSEFGYCGYGDGYSHNLYINACDTFILQSCFTHNAKEGHTIKSRARTNYILYNRIESANSTTSYEINLPNGGTTFIIGNQIQQGSNTHNSAIIDFGSEGISQHDSTLYIINNTIVNERNNGIFISVKGTQKQPFVRNNIFNGPGTHCTITMDSAGNYIGDPGFVNRAQFNFRLNASSPAINRGVAPGKCGSFDLTPQFMYVHNSDSENRLISESAIDIGAYEYNSVNVKQMHSGLNSLHKSNQSSTQPKRYNLMGKRLLKKSF